MKKYTDVYVRREENRAREIDQANYLLGRYILIAFNDPKSYPKEPYLQKKSLKKLDTPRKMTIEEMERNMAFNTKILGGEIK